VGVLFDETCPSQVLADAGFDVDDAERFETGES